VFPGEGSGKKTKRAGVRRVHAHGDPSHERESQRKIKKIRTQRQGVVTKKEHGVGGGGAPKHAKGGELSYT